MSNISLQCRFMSCVSKVTQQRQKTSHFIWNKFQWQNFNWFTHYFWYTFSLRSPIAVRFSDHKMHASINPHLSKWGTWYHQMQTMHDYQSCQLEIYHVSECAWWSHTTLTELQNTWSVNLAAMVTRHNKGLFTGCWSLWHVSLTGGALWCPFKSKSARFRCLGVHNNKMLHKQLHLI